MSRGKMPLIAYGPVADLQTWSNLNSAGLTGGQADPFGGTGAWSINDSNGGAVARIVQSAVITTDGMQSVGMVMKQGSASVSVLQLWDITAGVSRGGVSITWPSTLAALDGATIVASAPLSDGWRFVWFRTSAGVLKANSNRLELIPAGPGTAATGTALFYPRHVLAFGQPLDDARSFSSPRAGSEWVQTVSGIEEAWITGTDRLLSGVARHIPPIVNHHGSGWGGSGGLQGVNSSFDHWLQSCARKKDIFLWVPDRTLATVVPCYLAEPMQGGGELEENYTYRLEIHLRSSDSTPFTY